VNIRQRNGIILRRNTWIEFRGHCWDFAKLASIMVLVSILLRWIWTLEATLGWISDVSSELISPASRAPQLLLFAALPLWMLKCTRREGHHLLNTISGGLVVTLAVVWGLLAGVLLWEGILSWQGFSPIMAEEFRSPVFSATLALLSGVWVLWSISLVVSLLRLMLPLEASSDNAS